MPVFKVKVKPNARASVLEEQEDGSFIASLKAPPIDGKANAELIALLAKRLGVRRTAITIKSGAGARMKLVAVAD
jgi:uncharacterized protein YggU (UPF0235/DUF167 family)